MGFDQYHTKYLLGLNLAVKVVVIETVRNLAFSVDSSSSKLCSGINL